jgi:hypothetical protein
MRGIAVLTVVGVVGLAGVAQADKPPHPGHPGHPSHPGHAAKPDPKSCSARNVGYNASGTLVAASLTPAAGHHRYNGTIDVTITRANHRSASGDQKFTLTDARVFFHHGVMATAPAAGSRVGLHGKITELPRGCATTGFSPTVTVRSVDIHRAKLAKP